METQYGGLTDNNRNQMKSIIMPSRAVGKNLKPKVLVWTDLTLDNVVDIKRSETPEDTQSLLADIFHLKDWKEDLREGILVDLYFYTVHFGKDNGFTPEQMSAWFSIVKCVHEMAVDTPYGNVEPVFEYFKELLLCHSVKRPPYSVALFSVDQVKKLTTCAVNTYFRHFKMYKYTFTPKVHLDLSLKYVGLPETPEPSEVDEADQEADGGAEQVTGDAEKTEEDVLTSQQEDTHAVKELKAIINSALSEQVQKLKTRVDQRLKAQDEEIAVKMGISADVLGPPKSPKTKKRGK